MEEHRRHPRLRTFKGAKILINDHASAFDCMMKNFSEGGAMLTIQSVIGIPDTFDLQIAGEEAPRRCQVVRRQIDKLHVRFL